MTALVRILLALSLLVAPAIGSAQTKTYSTTPDFSRAELDQMLAPIALYPDTVLSHVLIAATYPLEVVQADRWARANTQHTGQSAVDAAEDEDWDPSVTALVAFPEILGHMSKNLDWTQRLGEAFLVDENEVMAVIQDLRQKAYASGSLKKMEYVRVQHDDNTIAIEPTIERVVYIPYYDTRAVYGRWWWPDHPPVYWQHPHNHIHVGGVYWGPRVSLGSGFFFSSFHWHRRQLVVIDRHHHHPGFYSGKSIAHYKDARRWQHNPHHRRGVNYRNDVIRHHYRSNHESAREQRHGDRAHHRHTGNDTKNVRSYPRQDHNNQRIKARLIKDRDQSSNDRQRRDLRDQRDLTHRDRRAQKEDSRVRQRDSDDAAQMKTYRTERRERDALRQRDSRTIMDRTMDRTTPRPRQNVRNPPQRDSSNLRSPSNMRGETHRAASGTGKSYHIESRDNGGSRENRR